MRTNPVTDPRAHHRNIAAWVERQMHDEFEIIAKRRGLSKGGLVRKLIEREVQRVLRRSALGTPKENGNGHAHGQP
jgi:hypothetical protein